VHVHMRRRIHAYICRVARPLRRVCTFDLREGGREG
jgi:hypothetical protein